MIIAIASAVALAAGGPTVSVKDDVFVKSSITVKKGTTVHWKWKGDSRHNVTVKSGPRKFHSSTKKTGSFSHKLTKKGTYQLVCTIHAPDMKMTIRVK